MRAWAWGFYFHTEYLRSLVRSFTVLFGEPFSYANLVLDPGSSTVSWPLGIEYYPTLQIPLILSFLGPSTISSLPSMKHRFPGLGMEIYLPK